MMGSDHRSVTAQFRCPCAKKKEERRYDELEKRLTGKHEAAAREEPETSERKHTMTTAVAPNDEVEILEQHTMT